mmetsp:Transcript_17411/g.29182  ORF Transcript_17411/g.29182 Transcript_17411/m.29182 type:complete len:778 (+) Transcript_17411:56-2389(+)
MSSTSLVPSGSTIFAISSMIFLSLRKACYRRNVNVLTLISQLCSASNPTKQKVFAKISSGESLATYWEKRDGENVYLEEVLGNEALQWVNDKNQKCIAALGDPTEDPLYPSVLSILESKDKIPHLRKIGSYYYNFWTDENHIRGIWRRVSSLEEYASDSCQWETVLDLDELGQKEGESWVYKGHTLNDLDAHKGVTPTRTLLSLSRGGADATVVREFDLETKTFVDPDTDNGFYVPEAKSRVSWLSSNEVLVGTDFDGSGDALTDSGYPRVIHRWKRGTPLSSSKEVYSGDKTDVSVSDYLCVHGGHSFEWRSRSLTFYTSKTSVRMGGEDQWHVLESLQEDAETCQFLNQMLISLRSDWKISSSVTYRSGSLLAVDILDFVYNGLQAHSLQAIFEPSADNRVSLDSYVLLRSRVVLHLLDNVKSRLSFWEYDESMGEWKFHDSEVDPVIRGASLRAIDSDNSDLCWFTTSTFLTPSQLSILDASLGASGVSSAMRSPLKCLPAQFDAAGLVEEQGQATSEDGTIVPFFILRAKNIKYDGSNPTLLYGYGGFEISLLPSYTAITGTTWLKNGGVYVSANIRGGGEFGPEWHQAALKSNRKSCYDDFIAVAEALIAQKITSSAHLGIRGGSNGGLLMGNMMTRRPDLFGAVVCQVPLLDMKRYSGLLAGASWMAEYGDPMTSDWEDYLKNYSAYHNIDIETAKADQYPPLLMMTSTRDDRVHPYHARSFVERLQSVGSSKVIYYENLEGGHGGAADAKQQAYMICLYTKFLLKTLKGT